MRANAIKSLDLIVDAIKFPHSCLQGNPSAPRARMPALPHGLAVDDGIPRHIPCLSQSVPSREHADTRRVRFAVSRSSNPGEPLPPAVEQNQDVTDSPLHVPPQPDTRLHALPPRFRLTRRSQPTCGLQVPGSSHQTASSTTHHAPGQIAGTPGTARLVLDK